MQWKASSIVYIGIAVAATLAAAALYAAVGRGIANPPPLALAACSMKEPLPRIAARAAFAEDLATGRILFSENADAQLPLASLTKVMTIITALEALGASGTVTVANAALTPEGDAGLISGEQWKASDLAAFTLTNSANDGARALALAAAADVPAFIEAMNAKGRELGLANTYFYDDTGLDVSSTTAGAYGSARDMAHLLAFGLQHHPAIFELSATVRERFVSLSGISHKAEPTSALPELLDGAIAFKTGFTDLAGGNLVALIEPFPGRPVAIAILGSTREDRDHDIWLLAEAAARAVKRDTLCQTLTKL